MRWPDGETTVRTSFGCARHRPRRIEHLADGEPRLGLTVGRQIARDLVHERQEDRLHGQVVPLQVERRRPHAAPGPRRRGVRSGRARRRRSGPARWRRAAASWRGSRRSAPPRNRRCAARGTARRPAWPYSRPTSRAACPRVRSTGFPGDRRQHRGAVLRPGAVLRRDHQQPAAALDEAAEALGGARRDLHVVEHDDRRRAGGRRR